MAMKSEALPKRYAKAFFLTWQQAFSSEEILGIIEECETLTEAIDAHLILRTLWYSSTFHHAEKKLFIDILQKTSALHHAISQMLTFLVARRRADILPDVVVHLRTFYRQLTRSMLVVVKSPGPIAPNERSAIENQVKALRMTADFTCDFQYVEDKALMGGFVVAMGQYVYDCSIQTFFGQLRRSIETSSPRELV